MTFPPWSSNAQWSEAHWTIQYLLQRHHRSLSRSKELASSINSRLNLLFPLMESLCKVSCTECRTCCCRQAKPFFDFKDLLYLHLREENIPVGQPIGSDDDYCRYLAQDGCLLPRTSRPWICTWYTCPAQINLLPDEHWDRSELDRQLRAIKKRRGMLEQEFIRVVA